MEDRCNCAEGAAKKMTPEEEADIMQAGEEEKKERKRNFRRESLARLMKAREAQAAEPSAFKWKVVDTGEEKPKGRAKGGYR